MRMEDIGVAAHDQVSVRLAVHCGKSSRSPVYIRLYLPTFECVGGLDHFLDRVHPLMRGPTLPVAILVSFHLVEPSRPRIASSRLVVIDCVSFRQHPLVQDTRNKNAAHLTPEKHDVFALLDSAQAGANVIARAAGRRVVGQPLAACFEVIDITKSLLFAPRTQRVGADFHQIGIGKAG